MPPEKRTKLPGYSPRIWHGMTAGVWFPFLASHRFGVSFFLIPLTTIISFVSLFNSLLRVMSEVVYSRKARRTEIRNPPVFVIGHWRTGTTLLHELLVTDQQFSYPNTYQCMAPSHFLISARFLAPLIDFLTPTKRPMDGMAFGSSHPQEDEIALMNLGVGSNYQDWGFPNHDTDNVKYLTLKELPERAVKKWKKKFVWLLQRFNLQDGRQIVLKSPTHTARIKILLELFPDAKFLHITRDPRCVLPSTMRMWTRMTDAMALQVRKTEYSLEGRIDVFNKMYDSYFADKELIPDENLYEIRFEDLLEEPESVLADVYKNLELGDFENARQGIRDYFTNSRNYQRNRYELAPLDEQLITTGCREYMQEYGYE